LKINKIIIFILLVLNLNANIINEIKPSNKHLYLNLSNGVSSIEGDIQYLTNYGFGVNYFYQNGLYFGGKINFDYIMKREEKNLKSKKGMNFTFKTGYSFSELAKGLSLYGSVSYGYLNYKDMQIDHNTGYWKEKYNSAKGAGIGGGIEYFFEKNWNLNLTYSIFDMKQDVGNNLTVEKLLFGIQYRFEYL
jgi:hypothetical protein